mgnify:CR=1 FL=1
MLFSSLPFLFYFLPCALGLYFLAPRRLKNAALLLCSLVFYAWGEPRFVLFMAAAILQGYAAARLMERYPARRRLLLTLSAVLSLGLLGYCKYADFLISGFNAVTGLSVPLLRITLPIGISFYTFQILSYVIDVYRGDAPAQRSLIDLAAYIAMFPQLVAGPIVRYTDVAPQLQSRTHTVQDAALGARRFVLGLGKKVLLANVLYELVTVYQQSGQKTVLLTWMYAAAYMMHVYFDFSGYSDMAIGLGRMFGFRFLENFDLPYTAKSIKEFWRRWHISLSSWFRDYLYIPLGGNRKGAARTNLNKFIVFFATGLWHGANWTFVLWGLWHGLFSTLEGVGAIPKRLRESRLGHVYTMLVVILGFTLFRADTLADAGVMFAAMFTGFSIDPANTLALIALLDAKAVFLLVTALLFAFGVPQWIWRQLQQRGLPQRAKTAAAALGYSALFGVSVLTLAGATFNPFIYFQF